MTVHNPDGKRVDLDSPCPFEDVAKRKSFFSRYGFYLFAAMAGLITGHIVTRFG